MWYKALIPILMRITNGEIGLYIPWYKIEANSNLMKNNPRLFLYVVDAVLVIFTFLSLWIWCALLGSLQKTGDFVCSFSDLYIDIHWKDLQEYQHGFLYKCQVKRYQKRLSFYCQFSVCSQNLIFSSTHLSTWAESHNKSGILNILPFWVAFIC